jgi:glycosyltransferase involved in cell wall biosynthesis
MNDRKRIIFINQAAAYLTIDIINSFAEEYECELYTGQMLPLSAGLNEKIKTRFFTRYDRSSAFNRVYTWAMFTIQVFFNLLFGNRKADLFIVSNPPTAPFLGPIFKKLKGYQYHLLIYDIYPDALVQFGKIKKNNFIHRRWSKLNYQVFKNANTVYTLSNNMAESINSYCAEADVHVIPNWADTSLIKPIEKAMNTFAISHGQVNKITVMYSGNMGATHAIEKIADLAAELKYDDSFSFILIGEGTKKPLLQKMKQEHQLDNLSILPYQSPKVLPFSLACADIGIVTLSSGAEDLSVPSKTYNLLAAGVPLLVIASSGSELASLVKAYDCGVQFEEDQTKEMVAFLKSIKEKCTQCIFQFHIRKCT